MVVTLQHNHHDGDTQQLSWGAKTLCTNGNFVSILEQLSSVSGRGITW